MDKLIEYNELANKFNKTIPDAHDTTKLRTNDSGGGNMSGTILLKKCSNNLKSVSTINWIHCLIEWPIKWTLR